MTDFPLYCVYCEQIAQYVFRGNSVCRRHFEIQSKKPYKKMPPEIALLVEKYKRKNKNAEELEGLSSLFG